MPLAKQGGKKMRFKNLFLTLVFALFLVGGAFFTSASAQHRRVIVYRPVYTRPFFGGWGFHRHYYDPFWGDMYRSPYEQYLEDRYYAQNAVAHDQKVLAEHREKYGRDGFLTDKERRKLQDDIKDLAKSRARLAQLNRNY
jgi:hypothetical protein